MGKSSKILVFILVAFVLSILAMALKEAGAGAVLSIAGVAIVILYQAMFKKNSSQKDTETDADTDITLKK